MTLENSQLNVSVGQEISSEFDVNSLENIESETTGQKPIKHCIDCGDPLAIGDNWTEAREQQSKYVCKSCWHIGKRAEMWVGRKYIAKSHPLWKPGRYKTFEEAAFESLGNYTRTKEGEVYIITNPAWPEWIKVGMAVDSEDRCNGYQTSSPFRDYEIVYSFKTDDRRKSERDAHTLIERFAEERRGEWFKITPGMASHLLSTIH